MTNSKLINYNIAQSSDMEVRIARMRESRREIVEAANRKKRKN